MIEYHTDKLQPMDDNNNREGAYRGSRYPNLFPPFSDEDEFQFTLRLVKHGISNMAIDNIMALCTNQSILPTQHFKFVYTLSNKIRSIQLSGIAKQWALSKIHTDAENPGTPYY